MPNKSTVISTTGILSRELNEINSITNKINNFMCVGGNGACHFNSFWNCKKLKRKFFVLMVMVLWLCILVLYLKVQKIKYNSCGI